LRIIAIVITIDLMKQFPLKPLLKPLDIPVIVLAAAITIIIGLRAYGRGANSLNVVVRGTGKTWIFPLEAEERVSVAGSIGETLVEIRNGRAAIVSSPCGGQTCVAAGELNKNGQWAACLPNRVFILIEGTGGTDVIDAASW
jgi:hypothetical protein